MKAVYAIFLAALLNMACSSGSSEEKPPVVPPSPTPTFTVTLEKQSISNGEELDAATTHLLTLTYNVNVIVNSSYSITLNGNRLMAQSKEKTVEIPLGLQAGKEYILQVVEGAIIAADDPSVKAPAFTLKFKTISKEESDQTYTIPAEPVTASAESAKKLYTYLLSQYGRKTISSVMADVNWNTTCAEKVYKFTGKYPAMNCYDFIHICYSAPNSWINYEDIKPVTDWVNAGGLVQLMWHFNVPKGEGASEYAFYSKDTSFKPSEALASGTWENKWFYEQMDKVIDIILKLQNAGIALTISNRKVFTTSSGYGPPRTTTAIAVAIIRTPTGILVISMLTLLPATSMATMQFRINRSSLRFRAPILPRWLLWASVVTANQDRLRCLVISGLQVLCGAISWYGTQRNKTPP